MKCHRLKRVSHTLGGEGREDEICDVAELLPVSTERFFESPGLPEDGVEGL